MNAVLSFLDLLLLLVLVFLVLILLVVPVVVLAVVCLRIDEEGAVDVELFNEDEEYSDDDDKFGDELVELSKLFNKHSVLIRLACVFPFTKSFAVFDATFKLIKCDWWSVGC